MAPLIESLAWAIMAALTARIAWDLTVPPIRRLIRRLTR